MRSGLPIKRSSLIYVSSVVGGPGLVFESVNETVVAHMGRKERISRIEIVSEEISNCTVEFDKPGFKGTFVLDTKLCRDSTPELFLQGVRCAWVGSLGFGLEIILST